MKIKQTKGQVEVWTDCGLLVHVIESKHGLIQVRIFDGTKEVAQCWEQRFTTSNIDASSNTIFRMPSKDA